MRLHEIAARNLDGVTETVVAGLVSAGSAEAAGPAQSPALSALVDGLRLPEAPAPAGTSGPPEGGVRCVVVAVEPGVPVAGGIAPLGEPGAGRALVALAVPPAALPLGPLVEALVRGGWAVREAVGVEHPTWRTVVVAERVVDGEVPALRSYLDPARAVPLAGAALLRLLDEHAVESLVARARLEALQSERDALAAEVAVLKADAVAYRETPPRPPVGGSVLAKARRRVGRIAGH